MEVMKYCGRQSMKLSWQIPENADAGQSDFREKMLENNAIDGIMSFEISETDGQRIFNYKIENMESLEARCSRTKLNGEQIKNLLTGILGVIFKGSEFMLNENDFCIAYDSVYFDAENHVNVAYFPGYNRNIIQQLSEIADFAMNNVDYHNDEAVVLIYSFYMRTHEENCSLEALAQLLKEKLENVSYEENTAGFLLKREDRAEKHFNVKSNAGIPENYEKEKNKKNKFGDKENSIEETEAKKFYNLKIDEEKTGNAGNDENCENDKNEKRRSNRRREETGEVYAELEKDYFDIRQNDKTGDFNYRDDSELFELNNGGVSKDDNDDSLSEIVKSILNSCSTKQKLVMFMGIIGPVLAVLLLIFSGLLNDATGKADMLKTAATILIAVMICLYSEKKIWSPLIRNYKNTRRIVKNESEDEKTVLLFMEDKPEEKETVLCSLVSDDFPAINITHVPFFVGSSNQMDSVLDEKGVSRKHLCIDMRSGVYTVSDLESTNGTRLNGRLLAPQEAVALKRGDRIEIGGCDFYFN